MPLFNTVSTLQRGNSVNLTTTLYQSYSNTCLLTLSAWNRQLSLRINPATGVDANGLTQYTTDRGQSLITSITQDNAMALLKAIEKLVLPAIEKHVASERVTITMGGNRPTSPKKAVTIYYDGVHCYLECAVGLDEHGGVPQNNCITHQFQEKTYMIGYDKNPGSGVEEVSYTDFYRFVEVLREAPKLTPIIAHQIRYDNALRSNANTNNNNSSSGFGNKTAPSLPAPTGAMQSINEFELPVI